VQSFELLKEMRAKKLLENEKPIEELFYNKL